MTISLKHKFASLIPDAGDPTIVQPSNWNDEHALTQATSTILGRVTAGPGVTEELTPAQTRTLLNVADGATANSADAFLLARANHTGTQSADTLTDGTTNKAFLATERTKLAGIATGASANSTDAFLLGRANHTGTQSADTLTDGTTNKAFLATERTKLAGIATGATANSSDATLLARANHTGTQLAATISDFSTTADLRIAAAVGVSVQAYDPDLTAIAAIAPSNDDIIQRKAGAWTNRTPAQVKTDLALAKGDVGLGNADNTSDATKNSATATLTNKRVTLRIGTTASSATPTPAGDSNDQFTVTALAAAAAFAAPIGTPTDGQRLTIRIKDNGTARALTWDAIYRAGTDVTLPSTTVLSKTMYLGFIYNSADSKWDLVSKVNNI
ncbi:hypothetical protein NKJ71_16585 [Mesorhizobium sp. M0050]|uniref:hypothetical protein n=1 Tax=Mesorhizobium sp. M0050 TaxID=2956861 RepID=UPI00333D0CE7